MKHRDLVKTLIYAFIIGIIVDLLSFDLYSDVSPLSTVFGFFIISPLTALLLIYILKLFAISNKILIVIVSVILFFLSMLIGFNQWMELRGRGGDMSGLLYYIGAIPSVLIGLLFGLYIANKIKSETLLK